MAQDERSEMDETNTIWVAWIDHGYDGEKERHFDTKEEAEAYAAEAAQDPYVMRVNVYAYPGKEI